MPTMRASSPSRYSHSVVSSVRQTMRWVRRPRLRLWCGRRAQEAGGRRCGDATGLKSVHVDGNVSMCPDRLPRQHIGRNGRTLLYVVLARHTCLGRYSGLAGSISIAFPGALFQTRPVASCDGKRNLFRDTRPLTVAGAAQVGSAVGRLRLLLPVELRHANHTASTNA